jgi:hypothetical protein
LLDEQSLATPDLGGWCVLGHVGEHAFADVVDLGHQ